MKALCEHHHGVDFAWLRRLRPGRAVAVRWSRAGGPTGSMTAEAHHQGVRLVYRYRQRCGTWREMHEIVTLTETETHFGGRRSWFACPTCYRPCRVLYGVGGFRCRLCLRLRYASQYETHGGRARSRAQKLRMRLGGSPNLLEPFPTAAQAHAAAHLSQAERPGHPPAEPEHGRARPGRGDQGE